MDGCDYNENGAKDPKDAKLVVCNKRRRKDKAVKWVKWVGIILDQSFTFTEHRKSRIVKARSRTGKFR